jgi:hypothetical protein
MRLTKGKAENGSVEVNDVLASLRRVRSSRAGTTAQRDDWHDWHGSCCTRNTDVEVSEVKWGSRLLDESRRRPFSQDSDKAGVSGGDASTKRDVAKAKAKSKYSRKRRTRRRRRRRRRRGRGREGEREGIREGDEDDRRHGAASCPDNNHDQDHDHGHDHDHHPVLTMSTTAILSPATCREATCEAHFAIRETAG